MTEQQLTVEEMKQHNHQLREQLTKKNQEYMFHLDKVLKAANYSEQERESTYKEMLEVLVEKQNTGATARQLFGTVSDCANTILVGPVKDTNGRSASWLIWLDGALLMGGLFALMSGITMLLNPEKALAMGLFTLLVNFVLGGATLLFISKFLPDFDKPKGQRGYLKYVLISMVAMVVWLFIVMASQTLVPRSINILLDPLVYVIIGVAALAGKWYVKKKYNITGTVM